MAIIPGIGSMAADIFYGAIAGFSIATLTLFLTTYQKYFQLLAAAILLITSFHILRTKPNTLLEKSKKISQSVSSSFFLGFFLALLNPSTLFLMTTMLTMLGVAQHPHTFTTGLSIICGLFCGEFLWWVTLNRLTAWLQHTIGKRAPITINTFTGFFLLILSILVIIKTVFFK
jgi:threonine/homoserine/homoserine lactone efflux protein